MRGLSQDPLTRPSCLTAVKVSRSLLYSHDPEKKGNLLATEGAEMAPGGRKEVFRLFFFLALSGTRCSPTGLVSRLPQE